MKKAIELSDHFTYGRLIRFTIPSIITMIFVSIYSVVDGFFVSNFVGTTPFAALNLIMPFVMIFAAVGFMLGSGGSALAAVKLGMGEKEHANEIFSLIVYTALTLGIIFCILGELATPTVAKLLGASDEMLPYCVIYARVCLLGIPAFMLQNTFQTFLITAEKPKFGLATTIMAGVSNMVLDALFMGVFGWGLWSAALATIIGQYIGGMVPLFYFLRPNSSKLRLGKTHIMGEVLLKSVTNGSSEFLSNISMSVVNMLYNFQLMRLVGENGVSAFGVIMYTNFVFLASFLGYSMGASPIAGYNLGAGNFEELKNIFHKSLKIISIAGIVMTALAVSLAHPLAYIFASSDGELLKMSTTAIRIYSLSFLFMGYNIFGSSFFTAMNNGFISALISFLRTLVFQVIALLFLPMIIGINGVWSAVVFAEICALFVTISCFIRNKNRYHYA
jgi:putative MATE family efflux protein